MPEPAPQPKAAASMAEPYFPQITHLREALRWAGADSRRRVEFLAGLAKKYVF